MNKKIIYVVGADFSGTTLLDLVLGSSPKAASLGEIAAYVNPTSLAQEKPICSCQTECGLWQHKHLDKSDPYSKFYDFHNVDILVDSSKQPSWILKQIRANKGTDRKIYVVLIWKNARAYAQSCASRNNQTGWAAKWIRYHRAILQLGTPLYSLSLEQFIKNPDSSLRDLCNWVGVQYDTNMIDYHKNQHHIVFGSSTAREKLHEKGSAGWKQEHAASFRSDFHSQKPLDPTPASSAATTAINEIQALLATDGLKTANLLPGKRYLMAAIFRKHVEKLIYRSGINPGTVTSKLRQFSTAARAIRKT